jgi:hypothetical protein
VFYALGQSPVQTNGCGSGCHRWKDALWISFARPDSFSPGLCLCHPKQALPGPTMLFNEDALLMKSGNSVVNFSIVNKMALALLDKEKSTKMSKRSKRLTAALDDGYRSLGITFKSWGVKALTSFYKNGLILKCG